MRYQDDRSITFRPQDSRDDYYIEASPRDGKLDQTEWAFLMGGGFVMGLLSFISAFLWVAFVENWSRWAFLLTTVILVTGYMSVRFFGEILARNTQVRDLLNQAFDSLFTTPEIEERVKNKEALSAGLLSDMMLATAYVQYQVQQGASASWSKRNLSNGPIGYPVGNKFITVGTVSEKNALDICKRWEEYGLLVGRGNGQAGEWVPQSIDEAYSMLLKGWKA